MSNVLVHICENDKNGKRSGFAQKFMFYLPDDSECFLEIDSRQIEGVVIKEFPHFIMRIYGVDFKFLISGDWVGSMAWNQYEMPAPFALGLINLLRLKDDFVLAGAWSNIARKWKTGEQIIAFDIGINDKTVVAEVIDPNQLDLFSKSNFCSNENYLGKLYRCKKPCGEDG